MSTYFINRQEQIKRLGRVQAKMGLNFVKPFDGDCDLVLLCDVVKEHCLFLFQSLGGCLYSSLSLANQTLSIKIWQLRRASLINLDSREVT